MVVHFPAFGVVFLQLEQEFNFFLQMRFIPKKISTKKSLKFRKPPCRNSAEKVLIHGLTRETPVFNWVL